ncbi:hypothetical protein MHYP_G00255120 [Metynnis hypsauchen]
MSKVKGCGGSRGNHMIKSEKMPSTTNGGMVSGLTVELENLDRDNSRDVSCPQKPSDLQGITKGETVEAALTPQDQFSVGIHAPSSLLSPCTSQSGSACP